MATKENELLKEFLIEYSKLGYRLFRCNSGMGWTGKSNRLPNGDVLLKAPRPFRTGWPKGTADLIGLTPITIELKDVGRTMAVFTAFEVKTGQLKATSEQSAFVNMVKSLGGIASVVYSFSDAIKTIKTYKKDTK